MPPKLSRLSSLAFKTQLLPAWWTVWQSREEMLLDLSILAPELGGKRLELLKEVVPKNHTDSFSMGRVRPRAVPQCERDTGCGLGIGTTITIAAGTELERFR